MVPRDEIVASLAGVLNAGEPVDHVAAAVGATLVLTDARLFVVRDGASYRPSSGIRSWPLDRRLRLRLTEHRNGQSALRIAAGADTEAVSLFVTTEQETHVRHVLAEARRLGSLQRRAAGERSVEVILTEWRERERELDAAMDDVQWAALQAQITALRTEHRAAVRARDAVGREAGKRTP